jgi:hypothetical protein
MTDLELLEQYEPTLRFAKSERFFPMAVEPYLEKCAIFPSGPEGVVEQLENLKDPMTGIGRLNSEQFYLRFVSKSFHYSDARRWLLAISLIGLAAGWFLLGWTGIEIDLLLSFLIALFLFMLTSPVRLRIIPSALAVVLFCGLSFAPIWFFLHPNEKINFAVEYLIALPIYVALLLYVLMRTLKFTIDRIIPEGPGMIMDMLSRATEKVAREAYFQYADILEKDPQPVYYGRVLHETDGDANNWTILQYHFFYAFNDWRLAANGMNHHEGDWELVAVYLKNDSPYAMLLSQHGAGNIEKWETTLKVRDKSDQDTTHPIVYVALGSHANYSQPDVIRSPSMYNPGKVQRVMFWVDGLIHYLFLLFNPDQKARQIALKEIYEQREHLFEENVFANLRDQADHYIVRLPMEIATGDGVRIGLQVDHVREKWMKSSSYLKRVMSNRKVTHPKVQEWRRVLLNSEHDWVQYKGLWGVKSWLGEESGPPGPRWDRPKKKQTGVKERIRWGSPLKWLEQLEKNRR